MRSMVNGRTKSKQEELAWGTQEKKMQKNCSMMDNLPERTQLY